MADERKKKQLGKGRHKSAMKRARQNERRRAQNRIFLSRVRTAIKTFRKSPTRETLAKTIPVIDRAASKGIFPRSRASRLVSRLTLLANRTSA